LSSCCQIMACRGLEVHGRARKWIALEHIAALRVAAPGQAGGPRNTARRLSRYAAALAN
jgi:hypothetical protein